MVLIGRKKTIEHIPDKIALKIIDYLSAQDKKNIAESCVRFHQLIRKINKKEKKAKKDALIAEEVRDFKKKNPKIVAKTNEKFPDLSKKKKSLLKKTKCLLCGLNKRGLVLRPCNHLIYCVSCGSKLESCLECGIAIQQKEEVNWKSNQEEGSDSGEKKLKAAPEWFSSSLLFSKENASNAPAAQGPPHIFSDKKTSYTIVSKKGSLKIKKGTK